MNLLKINVTFPAQILQFFSLNYIYQLTCKLTFLSYLTL